MTSEALIAIANQITGLIDSSVRSFNGELPAIEQQIFNGITAMLKNLEMTGDTISNSVANLKIIGNIKSKIESIVLNDAYLKNVGDFAKVFDKVTTLQNKYFSEIEGEYKPSALIKELKNQSINSTIDSLTEAGISYNVTEPIQDILRTNITSGATFPELLSSLRTFILTNKETDGALLRYSKEITTDSLNQYSATYNKVVSDDLGYSWYMYVGAIIETSRAFCIQMVKKRFFHKSEIPTLIAGDINGVQIPLYKKTGLPYGMIAGTNASNFQINRGGWLCNHGAFPVHDSMVPQTIKDGLGMPILETEPIPEKQIPVTGINSAEEKTGIKAIMLPISDNGIIHQPILLFRGDKEENIAKVKSDDFFKTNYNIGKVDKNPANIYFLSDQEKEAKMYGDKVTVWKTNSKIADLRSPIIQEKIAPYFEHDLRHNLDAKISNANFYLRSKYSTKTQIKSATKDLAEMNDILNDPQKYQDFLQSNWKRVINGQEVSDRENGILLRKILKENDFDGFIFNESIYGNTIGLFNRPEFIGDY